MLARSRKSKRIIRKPIPQRKPADYWSEHQNKIFKHVAESTGHSVVLASPGAGKSTTIVESLHHVPSGEESLCLAFNKSVASELTLKVPLGTEARTFHRLGLNTVREHWGKTYNLSGRDCIDQNDDGAMMLAASAVGASDSSLKLRENIVWAVKMAKTMLAHTPQEIEAVCKAFGISASGIDAKDFCLHVHNMLNVMKREPLTVNGNKVISFDDMLWLPHVHGWIPKQYDRVFVDEAQDLSASRVNLVMKALKPGGRLCAVGDRHQCIYGFAGADSKVIDKFIGDMNAEELPLSVSYRCPRKVVELAADINPDIQAADNAIEGEIRHLAPEHLAQSLRAGSSAVLSRNNFQLVSTAFNLIQGGVRATIIGKDIGNRFNWRIGNWNASTVGGLQREISDWREEMCAAQNKNSKNLGRINDEASSIMRFTEGANTVQQVQTRIKDFFSEKGDDHVKLSTCHKAKGLEWDHVYMLEDTFKPGKNQEEDNICYVSLTRCRKSLTFVR